MRIAEYLELLGAAQTVFDLRALAADGGSAAQGLSSSIDPHDLCPRGLQAARENVLGLCGREIGRFAAATTAAYSAFLLAMLGRDPAFADRAPRLAAALGTRRAAYLTAIDRGDPDSLSAWKYLGALYALDARLEAAFEPEVLPPYRVCRDLIALRLTPRPASAPVAPLNLLGLVAFADLFSVFRLDFAAFIRLLDRHGRPWAGEPEAIPAAMLPGLGVCGCGAGPVTVN